MSKIEPVDPVVHMLTKVNETRERARHYAGFAVGAVGYRFVKRRNLVMLRTVYEAANTKPTPHDRKFCAEMRLMEFAARNGAIYDLWLLSGQPRKEDVTPTLHPCEECREIMRFHINKGEVLHPGTMIVCVDAVNPMICEVFTAEQLFEVHGEPLSS